MRVDRAVLAGLSLALATAVISGFAIFINGYASREFDSATLFTTLKNAFVGLALLAFVLQGRHLREMRSLPSRSLAGLGLIAVVGGSIPFVLFFEGLQRVESGNAAFIHKTLFLWVAVLAIVALRERLGLAQLSALAALLVAQITIAGPGRLGVGVGEAMVMTATLLWAMETVLARKLLPGMSSSLAATARMAGGSMILVAYVLASGKAGAVLQLTAEQWAWALGTGFVLLLYVTTWYAALKRAPATAVTAVLTIGAPITAFLNVLGGRPVPSGEQVFGYVLVLAAVAAMAVALLIRHTSAPVEVRAAAQVSG
jgi:drug/metabolite transporter (DMT)-like permease